jgi:hypothetical protein
MHGHRKRPLVAILVEILFSVNTGFAGMSILFSTSLSASLPFVHLEVYLNRLLGIRQTDFIRGYFTIWIPSVVVAVCVWSLLRFLIRLGVTQRLLLSVAGIMILLSPAAYWTCVYERNGWSLQWPYKTIWGEATLATVCFFVFLKGPWRAWRRIGVLAFLGHCIFWYWFTINGFRSLRWADWEMPGYGGPFGMVLGFCALMIWCFYVYESRVGSLEVPSH